MKPIITRAPLSFCAALALVSWSPIRPDLDTSTFGSAEAKLVAHAQSSPRDSLSARRRAAQKLDSLGLAVERLEQAAYDLASSTSYQDPEDAQGARAGFFLGSVKLFQLSVVGDSDNARALFHLGAAMAKRSYTGFGTWDRKQLEAAVAYLERAFAKCTGRYASLRPAIRRDLERERGNLAALPKPDRQ